jgi:hypothetical protein
MPPQVPVSRLLAAMSLSRSPGRRLHSTTETCMRPHWHIKMGSLHLSPSGRRWWQVAMTPAVLRGSFDRWKRLESISALVWRRVQRGVTWGAAAGGSDKWRRASSPLVHASMSPPVGTMYRLSKMIYKWQWPSLHFESMQASHGHGSNNELPVITSHTERENLMFVRLRV